MTVGTVGSVGTTGVEPTGVPPEPVLVSTGVPPVWVGVPEVFGLELLGLASFTGAGWNGFLRAPRTRRRLVRSPSSTRDTIGLAVAAEAEAVAVSAFGAAVTGAATGSDFLASRKGTAAR